MSSTNEQLAQITQAVEIVRAGRQREWTEEFGNARAFICAVLEHDLSIWIKDHPYNSSDPRIVLTHYEDSLRPELKNDVIFDILFTPMFDNVARRELKKLKASSQKTDKAAVAQRYPEYPALCKNIRAAKQQWNKEDSAIKRSPSFRVMGGLARLGSRTGSEYRRLVAEAQTMERTVLGKTLTKSTRPK